MAKRPFLLLKGKEFIKVLLNHMKERLVNFKTLPLTAFLIENLLFLFTFSYECIIFLQNFKLEERLDKVEIIL